MERVLGLDVGTVRVGTALSDLLGMTAQPLSVIDRKKSNPFKAIAQLVEEYEVTKIVVGRPLLLSGMAGSAVQMVEEFVHNLSQQVSLPIEWWDERMTTSAAERAMISGGARREERRKSIDSVAAALILQSYLDAQAARVKQQR